MDIEALVFTALGKEGHWVSINLDDQPLDSIFGERVADKGVLVMTNQDLARLCKTNEMLADCGRKHPQRGIRACVAKVLPPNIPALDGNYTSIKQVPRSLRDFVNGVGGEPSRLPACVVGMDKNIFDQLRQLAGVGIVKSRLKTTHHKGTAPSFSQASNDRSAQVLETFEFGDDTRALRKKFIGESPSVELVRQLILRVANGDYPVLILGDTGTGKDVVARQIHEMSIRRSHPFIPVNCGGIASNLFESELFGHVKGAFTGAETSKIGLWQAAEEGTLFLDEIGDLPLEHQVKVLRALEARRGRQVGATREIKLRARVIAATNRDLASMVRQGTFREDLYYRLRVVVIHTPALREHMEDLPLLAQHLWPKVSGGRGAPLPPEVVEELGRFSWLGNVRMLKTVLTGIYALRGEKTITVDHVRAILKMETNYLTPPESRPTSDAEMELSRVLRLRHLSRVEETVRSTQTILQTTLNEQDQATAQHDAQLLLILRLRLEELDALCGPHRLLGAKIIAAIQRLRAGLLYLRGLLEEGDAQAPVFWREEVTAQFSRLLSQLKMEMGRLEPQA